MTARALISYTVAEGKEGAVFDTLVIGKGLIGAAAARHLSTTGAAVAILGPDEPADPAAYDGPFASHYDEGRITRQLGQDPIWSRLAQLSIAGYRALEAQSGVRFYQPVGLWHALPAGPRLAQMTAVGAGLGVAFEQVSPETLGHRAPMFRFPRGLEAIFEPAPAGHINPRAMLRAQLAVAEAQGATVLRETAVDLRRRDGEFLVTTAAGAEVRARQVLVAAGAFTNAYGLLPARLDLRAKTEIVVLARLGPAEAKRLAGMPALLAEIDSPQLDGIYLLPPLRYPDGGVYLKMGCNTTADRWPETLADMRAWFITGDSDGMLPAMREALLGLMPGLAPEAFSTRRCIICYTSHGRPYVGQVADGLFVAAGGNGQAAKSSDAIGRLAAARIGASEWPAAVDPAAFAVAFSGSMDR